MTSLLILLICIFPAAGALPSPSPSPAAPSQIGINYGQVADDLPSPASVVRLLRSLNVGRVKLYDADPRVLRAFANTGVEFIVGLPDIYVQRIAADRSAAVAWVRTNIQPHVPATKIVAVTVGNEVLTSNNTSAMQSLVPAMETLHVALCSLNLGSIAVTTSHSLATLATSFPPSAGAFRRDLLQYMTPLLSFHARTNSPFLINAYPYFAYKADPKRVKLEYVLFEPNSGFVDPTSGLTYDNMLHAQVDAVHTAVAAAGGKGIDVVVSETGWPSVGDADEFGATAENAGKYNGNLMKMVMEGKGSPARPSAVLQVYVFALFNENLKPGPASERHYGLFKPDGTPAYQIGIRNSSDYSSIIGGRGGRSGCDSGGADSPTSQTDGFASSTSSSTFMTISSATWERGCNLVTTTMAASLTGLVLLLAFA